jgi:hypothetical protein
VNSAEKGEEVISEDYTFAVMITMATISRVYLIPVSVGGVIVNILTVSGTSLSTIILCS